jgi:flagellar basal-body rod protein FlgC
MSIARSFEISASGLTAERVRMDVISSNLANVNTTRTPEGTPYRRRQVVFESADAPQSFASLLQTAQRAGSTGGVRVAAIEPDFSDFKRVHNPGHPDADPATGYVLMPNIEPVMEMVDLMTATRAYDANVNALNSAKQMQQKALEIGRV